MSFLAILSGSIFYLFTLTDTQCHNILIPFYINLGNLILTNSIILIHFYLLYVNTT